MGLIYGLLGEKLQHSFSPQIHSYIFDVLGIDAQYKLFEIKKEDLGDFVRNLVESGIKGINVTIPYKLEVMKHLDHISSEAERIGAVNTIAAGDRLIGFNTDYIGFGAMLNKHEIQVSGKSAVVLGTGGSARTIACYLIDNDISKVTIVSRKRFDSENSINIPGVEIIDYHQLNQVKNQDIIINCTPCGMYPNTACAPVDPKVLGGFEAAVDIIYNPKETLFLREARARGLKTANGLYMLAAQAVAAYKHWNGIELDKASIDEVYINILSINNF
ncbi:MAG: shikimate dehydrogenase [Bacillota bacterium]